MGLFAAVGSVYANMFNFSGRARRAEYWWFYLFFTLVHSVALGGVVFWLLTHPTYAAAFRSEAALQTVMKQYQDQLLMWVGIYSLASFFLFFIPSLSVLVRRLHDTDRRGWWMFKPTLVAILGGVVFGVAGAVGAISTGSEATIAFTSLLSALFGAGTSIWFLVVLCLPGTHGANRFGPDPIENRPPKETSHPALVKEMDEELGRLVADRRKEEFQDYYRARVLPAIERQKAARRV